MSEQYCTRCEKKLNKNNMVMLELDQRTDTYHNLQNVPQDKSQGWFPFGKDCAKVEIQIHKDIIMNTYFN